MYVCTYVRSAAVVQPYVLRMSVSANMEPSSTTLCSVPYRCVFQGRHEELRITGQLVDARDVLKLILVSYAEFDAEAQSGGGYHPFGGTLRNNARPSHTSEHWNTRVTFGIALFVNSYRTSSVQSGFAIAAACMYAFRLF